MDIMKAFALLNEYYPKRELENIYRNKKFDGSESDTIEKHKYNAELLREKAEEIHDEEKKQDLWEAARAFVDLAQEEWCNK